MNANAQFLPRACTGIEGLDFVLAGGEIAGVLGAPPSTVKSRLYRGLEALRGTLEAGVS